MVDGLYPVLILAVCHAYMLVADVAQSFANVWRFDLVCTGRESGSVINVNNLWEHRKQSC